MKQKKSLNVLFFIVACCCMSVILLHSSIVVYAEDAESTENVVLNDDIVFNGNYTLKHDMDLNGKTMTITGDLRHSSGIINIGNGTLIVNGDYLMTGVYGGSFTMNEAGSGGFHMTEDDGVFQVDGNVEMTSSADCAGYQTAGTLRVGGNLDHNPQ